jgi:cbb3-type cytochrome oxidase subunit 3
VLQELAAQTGAAGWAIASTLFFLVVWLAIAWRVFRTRPADMEARARLALEGDAEDRQGVSPGARTEALTRGNHG